MLNYRFEWSSLVLSPTLTNSGWLRNSAWKLERSGSVEWIQIHCIWTWSRNLPVFLSVSGSGSEPFYTVTLFLMTSTFERKIEELFFKIWKTSLLCWIPVYNIRKWHMKKFLMQWIFVSPAFFSFFNCLDPDSGSEFVSGSTKMLNTDLILDLDPQHCWEVTQNLDCDHWQASAGGGSSSDASMDVRMRKVRKIHFLLNVNQQTRCVIYLES